MARNKKKSSKRPEVRPVVETQPKEEVSIGDQQPEDSQQNSETLREHDQSLVTIGGGVNSNGLESCTVPNAEIKELKRRIKELELELERERASNKDSSNPESDKSELVKVKIERDEFEKQYNNLLSRISSMKNVFNKMKESQGELQLVQEQLSAYESQNIKLKQKIDSIIKEKAELEATVVTLNKEFSSIERERETVQKECSQFRETIKSLEKELENFSDSHTHELDFQKSQYNQLTVQLEEMMLILDNNRQDMSVLHDERDDLKSNLSNILKENEILKDSLKEMEIELEQTEQRFNQHLKQKEDKIVSLKEELDKSKVFHTDNANAIENLTNQMEKMREDVGLKKKYEKECKDRILQIGKLRHEAIILNEHLTKALAMLKQSSDSESVDKELISNLLISFVAIPRADPRKFEVLELLSSFLNWDDDKKRQAGLILDSQNSSKSMKAGSNTENFVSMWTDYLEKESE